MEPDSDWVQFDILLRAPGSGGSPSVETIQQFRPDPGVIEECRRHLALRGITCHATDFGLACGAPRALFEEVFSTHLKWLLSEDPDRLDATSRGVLERVRSARRSLVRAGADLA